MKYKKESLIKLLKLVDELSTDPENEWFKSELENKFTATSTTVNPSAINEIYEYCIKVIIKDHAEKFYFDFKLIDIKQRLVEDFIRMEQFRREGNFEDFCLAAYQQLEAIVNRLFSVQPFVEYLRNNKSSPAILKYDFATQSYLRKGNLTLGKLIFLTGDLNKINDYMFGNVNNWFFTHKFRAVLYYYYFNTEVKTNSDLFDKIYEVGNFLYQGRNLNHRGSIQNPYQQTIIDDLLPNQHRYYFKFLGFLEDVVTSFNKHL